MTCRGWKIGWFTHQMQLNHLQTANSIALGKSASQTIYSKQHTQKIGKTRYNMLYIAWMVSSGDLGIKKTSLENFNF